MQLDLNKYQPNSYIKFVDVVPWGFTKRLGAYWELEKPTQDETDAINLAIFHMLVTEMNVRDINGMLISKNPPDLTVDDIDRMDTRIVAEVINTMKSLINQVDDPNA